MLLNGLRIVVIEEHRRPVVMIRLMFGNGAASDLPGAHGKFTDHWIRIVKPGEPTPN